MKLAHVRNDVNFATAFAAARVAKADQFRWRGNDYTTICGDGLADPAMTAVFYIEEIKDVEGRTDG
jgi:hypothetical protein